MGKRLEDRSLEELWQLFPIFLVPHKKEWAGWYREEKGRLEVLLGAGRVKRVSHIGSTAVSGIWAKNIIDILLEVPDKKRMAEVREILKNNGWLCMNTSKNRISMNKGYTERDLRRKCIICISGCPAIMMNCIFSLICRCILLLRRSMKH